MKLHNYSENEFNLSRIEAKSLWFLINQIYCFHNR
jgi:hypothetical protein